MSLRFCRLDYLVVRAATVVLPRGQRDRWRREWLSTLDEMHAERQTTVRFALDIACNAPRIAISAHKLLRHGKPARLGTLLDNDKFWHFLHLLVLVIVGAMTSLFSSIPDMLMTLVPVHLGAAVLLSMGQAARQRLKRKPGQRT